MRVQVFLFLTLVFLTSDPSPKERGAKQILSIVE